MEVKILTDDISIIDEIFLNGKKTMIIPNTIAEVTLKGIVNNALFDDLSVIHLLISHIDSVTVGIIATWIFEIFKTKIKPEPKRELDKTFKLIIEKEEIRITKDEIVKTVEKHYSP